VRLAHTQEALHRELEAIMRDARHVRIVRERLEVTAGLLADQLRGGQSHQADPRDHPDETVPENHRETLQFLLVLTSQHFCIWLPHEDTGTPEAWQLGVGGRTYTGAKGINAAFVRALREGCNVLDASFLASMTMADLRHIYRDERGPARPLHLMNLRLNKLREIGTVLLERYDGQAAGLFEEAGGRLYRPDGLGLVQALMREFPISYYDWPFCKLAILLGKLVSSRVGLPVPTSAEFRRLATFEELDEFEVAADYYIPLFLIRVGALAIDDELRNTLSAGHYIARDSAMEREFRAATMLAGRQLAVLSGQSISEVDEALWRMGFAHCRPCFPRATESQVPCWHRPTCKAYHEEENLMEIRWPLVMTPRY
jgi:hypothetical protein